MSSDINQNDKMQCTHIQRNELNNACNCLFIIMFVLHHNKETECTHIVTLKSYIHTHTPTPQNQKQFKQFFFLKYTSCVQWDFQCKIHVLFIIHWFLLWCDTHQHTEGLSTWWNKGQQETFLHTRWTCVPCQKTWD